MIRQPLLAEWAAAKAAIVAAQATAAAAKGRKARNGAPPEGAWLDSLHRALDEAVAVAYGWPADLPDDAVLARLLALNRARSGAARG